MQFIKKLWKLDNILLQNLRNVHKEHYWWSTFQICKSCLQPLLINNSFTKISKFLVEAIYCISYINYGRMLLSFWSIYLIYWKTMAKIIKLWPFLQLKLSFWFVEWKGNFQLWVIYIAGKQCSHMINEIKNNLYQLSKKYDLHL